MSLNDGHNCVNFYPGAIQGSDNLGMANAFCKEKMVYSGRVLTFTSQLCKLTDSKYFLEEITWKNLAAAIFCLFEDRIK